MDQAWVGYLWPTAFRYVTSRPRSFHWVMHKSRSFLSAYFNEMMLTSANRSEYGINFLASTTGEPIRVLTYSQGGLNAQWALTFFPSTRRSTFAFTALAPHHKGTSGLVIDAQYQLTRQANAASLQQASDSNLYTRLPRTVGTLHLPRRIVCTP
jgi:hypothetical protein